MLARDVAERVSMQALLRELGFVVNERTRRCACPLHTGKNPSAFSWKDTGEWFCFSCGRGGDKLALVQEAKRCDFKDALKFLAVLAGVDLDDSGKLRAELARARENRRKREAEEARVRATERLQYLKARDEVLELEALRRNAGRRLAVLAGGWCFDDGLPEELAWEALQLVANEMPRAAAAYTVIAFGNSESRNGFSTHPEQRTVLVNECVEAGGVHDDKGHFVELVL